MPFPSVTSKKVCKYGQMPQRAPAEKRWASPQSLEYRSWTLAATRKQLTFLCIFSEGATLLRKLIDHYRGLGLVKKRQTVY